MVIMVLVAHGERVKDIISNSGLCRSSKMQIPLRYCLIKLSLNQMKKKAICLSDKIVDADNMPTSIIKCISGTGSNFAKFDIYGDYLTVTASSKGETKLTIHAKLNGKSVEKKIRVDIRE